MTRPIRGSCLLAIGCAVAIMSTAAVAQDKSQDPWQFLQLQYRNPASQPTDPADALWSSEIAAATRASAGTRNPGLPINTIVFVDGARSIVVSIPLQIGEACDLGPNHFNATRDYALCPAKLAVIEGGRIVKSSALGPLCAETINDGGVTRGRPGWQDPAQWGTRGRYDPASHTINLITMQNGRAERACSKTIKVD